MLHKIFQILILLFSFVTLSASEQSRKEYLELVKQYPALIHYQGDASKGEIEIILDENKMATIEKHARRDVGLIARDKFWLWINDACLFPNGKTGVYGRILSLKALESPITGVAVMPVLPDGKIALNCNFRHATRTWEIELPRGSINQGEDAETAARRETKEETGMEVGNLTLLGEMTPDTGLTSTIVPVFSAKVIAKEQAQVEDAEAIEEILSLSLDEIKKGFHQGFLEMTIRGEKRKVFFRDPFLSYALFLSY